MRCKYAHSYFCRSPSQNKETELYNQNKIKAIDIELKKYVKTRKEQANRLPSLDKMKKGLQGINLT